MTSSSKPEPGTTCNPITIRRSLLSILMNSFFNLLYSHLAWIYDLVAWLVSGGAWWDWQKSALFDGASGQILELGSGTGHLLVDLLTQKCNVYGMDRSRQMISITGKKLRDRGFPAVLVRADTVRLPFPSSSFDLLLATFPPPALLHSESASEYFRLLKPGGRLHITLGLSTYEHENNSSPVQMIHTFLSMLYRNTLRPDQLSSLESSLFPAFSRAGFQTTLLQVEQKNAVLLVLCCTRSTADPPVV
ncbi:MAG: class I SAM-dependent methyltransferase [Anaerolineales bacterium]|nr:class I SAM-dependent methyltransferase [Anaerolineales bacterium]